MSTNYIGVFGHRGSGKTSIGYLLTNAVEYLINPKAFGNRSWDDVYKSCVLVCMNETYPGNYLRQAYYLTFSEDIIFNLSSLTGIRTEDLFNDTYKDTMYINLRTMDAVSDPDPAKITTREELFESRSRGDIAPIDDDIYILARDFILYYAHDVMQRFFGSNIWLIMHKYLNSRYDIGWFYSAVYRIYTDVKSECEYEYLKELGASFVEVRRPEHKKEDTMLSTYNNFKPDYTIDVNGDLMSLKDTIYNIAKQIVERNAEKTKSDC